MAYSALVNDPSLQTRTVPNAIVDVADDADGYIQVTVEPDGRIHVRGSRHMVAQFVAELQAQGIEIHFSGLHWCG
jgi:hypothetical protein